MNIREKIFESIQKMDPGELSLLYKQVKMIETMRTRSSHRKKEPPSIEKIHEMTATSHRDWSDPR